MTGRLNLVSLILAIAGVAVAGYLTYVHYNVGALVCGVGDCEIVQSSKYSEMFGIPIAIFGLLMYVAIVALIIIRSTMIELEDLANTAILVFLVAGTIYAAYLTYLEIEVIRAICQWCVISAIITVLLLIVESIRMTRSWNTTGSDLDAVYEED
jgi:uncharacterized membrane protein